MKTLQLQGFEWWAVQDLNLRPLAGHAHISCSALLYAVQISPNRSTFCPLRFAGECSNFLAFLTPLLTEFRDQFLATALADLAIHRQIVDLHRLDEATRRIYE